MASQRTGRTQIKLLGSKIVRNIVAHKGEEMTDTRRNLTCINPVITLCTLHKIKGSQIKKSEVGCT